MILEMPVAAPPSIYEKTKTFGSLDGLRALSILGVIWFHAWIGTPGYYQWLRATPVLGKGEFGVDVFFCLSGFLITTLLLRERRISLRGFYIRRTLRIWPLYYAMLLFYVALVGFGEHGPARQQFFHFLPGYSTFTYTWMVPRDIAMTPHFNFAWSLATEEQFYCVWPLVLCLVPWMGLRLGVMAGMIGLHWVGTVGPDTLGNRIMAGIAVPICLGSMLGLLLANRRSFEWLLPLRQKQAAPALAIGLLAAVGAGWTWLAWLALVLLVGACVIREDNGLAWLLRNPVLKALGRVSYGMYLFNLIVVATLRRVVGNDPWVIFPLTVAVTYGLAALSFRFYETPFLRLKDKLSGAA